MFPTRGPASRRTPDGVALPQMHEPDHVDQTGFDAIIVNTYGKESQVMLDVVATAARAAGVLDRITVLHCDVLRLVASVHTREISAHDVIRILQHGGRRAGTARGGWL